MKKAFTRFISVLLLAPWRSRVQHELITRVNDLKAKQDAQVASNHGRSLVFKIASCCCQAVSNLQLRWSIWLQKIKIFFIRLAGFTVFSTTCVAIFTAIVILAGGSSTPQPPLFTATHGLTPSPPNPFLQFPPAPKSEPSVLDKAKNFINDPNVQEIGGNIVGALLEGAIQKYSGGSSDSSRDKVHVSGYTDKNGRAVSPHERSRPTYNQ